MHIIKKNISNLNSDNCLGPEFVDLLDNFKMFS